MKGLSNNMGISLFDAQVQLDLISVVSRVERSRAPSDLDPKVGSAIVSVTGDSEGIRSALSLVYSLQSSVVSHLLSSFFVPVAEGVGSVEVGVWHSTDGVFLSVQPDYLEDWVERYIVFIAREAEGVVGASKVYRECRSAKVGIFYPELSPFHSPLVMAYRAAFREMGYSLEDIYFGRSKYFFVFVLVS